MKLNLPFCQLSVIDHISTNQVLRCWFEGGFVKKSPQTVFLSSRLLPYSAIPLCRSFAFAMTKHSSKPGRLSDHSRNTAKRKEKEKRKGEQKFKNQKV